MNDPEQANPAPNNDPQMAGLAGWLPEIARRAGISLGPAMSGQLLDYFRLLRTEGEKINLTAILDDEGIAVRHLLDSLSLLPYLDRAAAGCLPGERPSLVDVGSGAGLPGLLLKIVRPDWSVLLLDSLAKRVRFLQNAVEALHLEVVTARHARAEDAARLPEWRGQFTVATARAVAALPVLCEYCLPFVRTGGLFLAMKGQADEEIAAAKRAIGLLGGELQGVESFELPGTAMRRAIVVIRKVRPTPEVFPRRSGQPEAKPLL
jgi:16S rRNA (guanine527-N7)-methyltransferase